MLAPRNREEKSFVPPGMPLQSRFDFPLVLVYAILAFYPLKRSRERPCFALVGIAAVLHIAGFSIYATEDYDSTSTMHFMVQAFTLAGYILTCTFLLSVIDESLNAAAGVILGDPDLQWGNLQRKSLWKGRLFTACKLLLAVAMVCAVGESARAVYLPKMAAKYLADAFKYCLMAVLAASLFTVISSSQLAMRHKMALGVTIDLLCLPLWYWHTRELLSLEWQQFADSSLHFIWFLPECLALVSLVVIMSKLDKEREASASTPDIPIGESLVALCL